MKVEVGDWVKLRGMRRIYEVEAVQPADGTYAKPFDTMKLAGNKAWQPVHDVEKIAPKFWIRKERMR